MRLLKMALLALALTVGQAQAEKFELNPLEMDGVTAGRYVAPAQVRLDLWNYWNNNKGTWGNYKLDKAKLDFLIQVEPNLNNGERVFRIKDVNVHFLKDAVSYFQRRNGKEWVHRAWRK